MSSSLEKLTFTILLLDKVSDPAKGVCKSIEKIQSISKAGFQTLGKGIAGITAVALGLNSLTGRARDFERALAEVGSLDAPVEELNKLGKTSKQFAMRFGGDAAAISRSAYDVQSAIPGLAKGALAAFTYQANLLAKAGKATSKEVTEFFGTMYSVFETDAKKIGEGKWIDQLTGKMAYAVKMYKTTMPGMAAAFSNLGAAGKVSGISLDEQTAVLGILQGTMGGANAGSAYKTFLSQVAKAGGVLRLSFQDSNKKMLPIVDILEKIKKEVGPGELKLGDQKKLFEAFGVDGAKVVMNLLDKTDKLKGSIAELSKVQSSKNALEMAEKMTDPLERFTGTLDVLRITLGQTLLPVVNAVLSATSRVMMVVQWLLETIPPLRWIFAGLALVVTGVMIAFSSLYVISGLLKIFKALGMELRMIYAWCLKNATVTHSMTAAQRANAIAQMLWQKSIGQTVLGQKLAVLWTAISSSAIQFWTFATSKATAAEKLRVMWSWICTNAEIAKNFAINAGIGAMLLSSMIIAKLAIGQKLAAMSSWIMTGGLWAATSAAWAFTVALLANPVTWVVLGIGALIGALVALVYCWDDICNFCVKYADYLLSLLGPIGWVIVAFRNWDKITAFLQNLWGTFQKVCPNIANLIEKTVAIIWAGGKAPFVWIAEKIRALGTLFTWLGSVIAAPFKLCYEWLSDKLIPVVQFFSGLLEGIQNFFSGLFSGISGFGSMIAEKVIGIFSDLDGWIGNVLRKISKIPGFGFLNPDVSADGTTKPLESVSKIEKAAGADLPVDNTAMTIVASPGIESVAKIEKATGSDAAPAIRPASGIETPVIPDVVAVRRQTDVAAGGIRNMQTTNNNYGGISIFAPNGMNPAQLDDWLTLQT